MLNFLGTTVAIVGVLTLPFSLYFLISRANKMHILGKMIIYWLIPIYPIGFIIAHIIPKDEACGFAGFCVGALIGLMCALIWFAFFPLITSIVLDKKLKNQI